MPSQKSAVRLIVEPLALAVGLAFALRCVVQIYAIPSASMRPTLEIGDQIVVTRYLGSDPQRGDVVVFHAPSGDELMVKRIVGLPGDLVETRRGRLVVRGHAVPEIYLAEQGASGFVAPRIVPAGSFFVMGDNRGHSVDSRAWGPLPRSLVIGRARFVLWSSARALADRPAALASTPASDTAPQRSLRLRLFRPIE